MKVFSKISIPVSLAIVLSIVAVAFFSYWFLQRQLFSEVFLERKDDAIRTSRVLLDRDVFEAPFSDESQKRLYAFIENLRAGDVVRLTLWNTEGTVLTSDLLSIRGKQAVRHPELNTVYQTRKPLFIEKKFDDNEPLQSSITPVRIVLVPLFFENTFAGVVEIHMTNVVIGDTIKRSVYSLSGLLVATGILLVLSMVVVVRKVIVEPIHKIAFASKRLEEGDFDADILVETNDEIGFLAKAFSSMRNQLRKTIVELQEKKKMAEVAEKKERIATIKIAQEKEELQKFKLAADNSFDHVVITDPDAKVLYANKAAERLTGFSFEEMKGKTPALWGKQMPKAFYEEFWYVIKTKKEPFSGEVKNIRRSGERYLASIRVSPILDSKGDVRFFVGVERDITDERTREEVERRHIEDLEDANQKITQEKVRAEGILRYLRSIGEGVFATDRNGTIVFSNATAAEMVGKTEEEIIGGDSRAIFRFCMGADDKVCDFIPFYEAVKIKKTLPFPAKSFLVGKEGMHVPVSGTLSPIVEERHIAGAIVVFQDITERYEVEQMKDRFLSVAAHQLRTPLGSMRWSMELLENGDLGKLPKQAKEAVGELHKNSDRMMMLVNDLLNVSRIDQGEIKEEASEEDLLHIVTEVTHTLEGDIAKKKMQLKVSTAKEKEYPVILVKKHVFEAVENLVSNAIRYGKEGGSIAISLERTNESVVLKIADDGIGIPKADQANIFSKFFRAANAVKSFTDGSGLGLSVVKSYVEESHGEISFESEENVGTTFTVCFPLHKK